MGKLNRRAIASTISAFFCALFVQAVSAELKIAGVDIEAAIRSAAYTMAELEQLKQNESFKTNFEQYSALRSELKKLQDEAKVNSLTWSEEQKKTFSEGAEAKVEKLNAIGQTLDRQKAKVEREIQEVMMPIVNKAMVELIKEKELDVILKPTVVHFLKPELDLTKELVTRLDKLQVPKNPDALKTSDASKK